MLRKLMATEILNNIAILSAQKTRTSKSVILTLLCSANRKISFVKFNTSKIEASVFKLIYDCK